MDDLCRTFHRHFEVVPACTPDLLAVAQSLRYQVYCVEQNLEDANRFPDRLERDEFDAHSVHSVIRHRDSECFAGVVRLVLPDVADADRSLPLERHLRRRSHVTWSALRRLPRGSVAEISRFAVSKTFKRRICEHDSPAGASDSVVYDDEGRGLARRFLPHITVGLFAAIVRMSAQHGITHWQAIMEPRLLRLLTRFGIHFQPVGPVVSYHGRRQPSVGVVDDVLDGIYRARPDVWDIITDGGRLWPARETAWRAQAGA